MIQISLLHKKIIIPFWIHPTWPQFWYGGRWQKKIRSEGKEEDPRKRNVKYGILVQHWKYLYNGSQFYKLPLVSRPSIFCIDHQIQKPFNICKIANSSNIQVINILNGFPLAIRILQALLFTILPDYSLHLSQITTNINDRVIVGHSNLTSCLFIFKWRIWNYLHSYLGSSIAD